MADKITILYIHNNYQVLDDQWGNYMGLLPVEVQNDIEKYLFTKDRQVRLLSKLLLKEVLNRESPGASLLDIKYGEFKKPYLESDLSFNLSHSEDYVVCAFVKNKEPIGVDIEKIDIQMEIDDFRNVFSLSEWSYIQSSYDIKSSFYHLWTIKESVIKADGRGLHIPLQDVKIQSEFTWVETKKWYHHEIKITDDYKCHLALPTECSLIEVQELSIVDLYQNLLSKKDEMILT